MALLACDKNVSSMKGKASDVVIKYHFCFPSTLVMTALARLTFLATMRIVKTMTRVAAGSQLFLEN